MKTAPRKKAMLRLAGPAAVRAMRTLVDQLPLLRTKAGGEIDFAATPQGVLASIATQAETSSAVIGLGLSAVGSLMAYAAPEMEDGTISSDTVEALGWLMAELGEMAAACFVLATLCRRHSLAPNAAGGPPDAASASGPQG